MPRDGLVLTHGARFHADSELLVAIDAAIAASGVVVHRYNLPYRQADPEAFPAQEGAPRDREGLREAALAMRKLVDGRVFLGGQSYGGLQSTLIAASEPDLVEGLLLLSYPLQPAPGLTLTQHFPSLKNPALFVHGSQDPLGSLDGMRDAIRLIPARTELLALEGAAHELGLPWVDSIAESFLRFFG